MSVGLSAIADHYAQSEFRRLLQKIRSLEQRVATLETAPASTETETPTIVSINGNWGGIFAARPATTGIPEGTLIAVDDGVTFTYYILSRTTAAGAVDWQTTGWGVTF